MSKTMNICSNCGEEWSKPHCPKCAEELFPEKPTFEFVRYNPRRNKRGAEAAEVKVTWQDGGVEFLWMSMSDIKNNQRVWGDCEGLTKAMAAYIRNVRVE